MVQVYVSLPDIGLTTPKYQLKGFAKALNLEKGESTEVNIRLDKYAFSFWDENEDVWQIAGGKHGIHVGTSSDNLVLEETFESVQSFTWSGL